MNGVDMMTTSFSPLSLTPISHPYLSDESRCYCTRPAKCQKRPSTVSKET